MICSLFLFVVLCVCVSLSIFQFSDKIRHHIHYLPLSERARTHTRVFIFHIHRFFHWIWSHPLWHDIVAGAGIVVVMDTCRCPTWQPTVIVELSISIFDRSDGCGAPETHAFQFNAVQCVCATSKWIKFSFFFSRPFSLCIALLYEMNLWEKIFFSILLIHSLHVD